MSARIRNLVFLAFISVFFLVAPILILYTAGYRYNLVERRIERTGVLIVDGEPKGATIAINGVVHRQTLPARIPGLHPGRYEIEVSAPNRTPWKKRLWVEEGRTIFANTVMLWPERLEPKNLLSEDIRRIVEDPTHESLAVITREKTRDILTIVALRDGTATTVPLSAFSTTYPRIINVWWSAHGKRLRIVLENPTAKTGDALFRDLVFSPQNNSETLLDLATLTALSKRPDAIDWDAENDDLLHAFVVNEPLRRDRQVFTVNLFRGDVEKKTTLFPTTMDFTRAEDGTVAWTEYQRPADDETVAQLVLVQTERTPGTERRIALPGTETAPFFVANGPSSTLTLLDSIARTLFIIDKRGNSTAPIQETILGVDEAAWSPDGSALLWRSGKELWILDINRATRTRLITEKDAVSGILWHPTHSSIMYRTAKEIVAMELDDRDVRNTVRWPVNTDVSMPMILDADGDALVAVQFGASERTLVALPLK